MRLAHWSIPPFLPGAGTRVASSNSDPFQCCAYLAVAVANLILIISSSYSALCISLVSDDMGNDLRQYTGIVHDKLRREETPLIQARGGEKPSPCHHPHPRPQPPPLPPCSVLDYHTTPRSNPPPHPAPPT